MHLGQVRECTKLELDRRSCSVFNAEMPARIPRALKKKRTELTGKRHNLIKEIQKIDREIRAIDHAIKLIAPSWIPSPGTSRSFRARTFRKGTITKACLEGALERRHQSVGGQTQQIPFRFERSSASSSKLAA
jgi:hypothetical protein